MSRELRICPGVGGQKCDAFLSSLDRDPHPTCARCRGKICTHDMTCDLCVDWSPAQWELFAKKRTYAERKCSRPSGSVPPAPKASHHARTSSEVMQPGTSSSSSSRPSGGQDKRRGGGGSTGAPGVTSREAPSPPTRSRSQQERWKCLWAFVCCSRARLCLFCSFGGCREGGCSVAVDSPCPRRFLGCFFPLIAARSVM